MTCCGFLRLHFCLLSKKIIHLVLQKADETQLYYYILFAVNSQASRRVAQNTSAVTLFNNNIHKMRLWNDNNFDNFLAFNERLNLLVGFGKSLAFITFRLLAIISKLVS